MPVNRISGFQAKEPKLTQLHAFALVDISVPTRVFFNYPEPPTSTHSRSSLCSVKEPKQTPR